jgi:predicted RNA-binding protein with PIN domain
MKRYLIDGNNVVCAWKHVPKPVEGQEDEFLMLVKSLLKGDDRAIVVFDGPPRSGFRLHAIEVRYSREQKADAILLWLIENDRHPEQLVVVSDDRQVLQAAKHCRCMHARAFLAEAEDAGTESEKPNRLSPEERRQWLKDFGIKDQ